MRSLKSAEAAADSRYLRGQGTARYLQASCCQALIYWWRNAEPLSFYFPSKLIACEGDLCPDLFGALTELAAAHLPPPPRIKHIP